ncbi:ankyrin repeat domain-containing protein [Leptospira sp. WS92.C1]
MRGWKYPILKYKDRMQNSLMMICIFLLFINPILGEQLSRENRKLLSASIHGNIRLAKKALTKGASVDTKDPRDPFLGETPLLKAVWNNDVPMVRFLLAQGADPNLADARGETPIITATFGLNVEVLRLLLKTKANPYAETHSGFNALIIAADLCSLPILRILHEAKINLNRQSKKGFLPIHAGARRCNEKFLKYLVDSGADVNARTNTGFTALMNALKFGNGEAIRFLLRNQAKTNLIDASGKDALYYLDSEFESATYNPEYRTDNMLDFWVETMELLLKNGMPLDREYKDGSISTLLLFRHGKYISKHFYKYILANKINHRSIWKSSRFGLSAIKYINTLEELSKFHSWETKQYEAKVLSLSQKSPVTTLQFLNISGIDKQLPKDLMFQIFQSVLELPKQDHLGDLLWKEVIVLKDFSLLKLLIEKYADPPIEVWYHFREPPSSDDTKPLEQWIQFVKKQNDPSFLLTPLRECRLDILERILKKKDGFYENKKQDGAFYWSVLPNCKDIAIEQKLYELLQNAGIKPKRQEWMTFEHGSLSSVCNAVKAMIDHSLYPKSKYYDHEIYQRQLPILLKMGASPNCFLWGRKSKSINKFGYITALEAVRNHNLKDLETLLLQYGAADRFKDELLEAIQTQKIANVKEVVANGAEIGLEELQSASQNPEILSYLLEEYNSLNTPVFLAETLSLYQQYANTIGILPKLLEAGFSPRVRSHDSAHDRELQPQYNFISEYIDLSNERRSCAVRYLVESKNSKLNELLRSLNFENYSCRGFHFESPLNPTFVSYDFFRPKEESFFTKEMEVLIRTYLLNEILPELEEKTSFSAFWGWW